MFLEPFMYLPLLFFPPLTFIKVSNPRSVNISPSLVLGLFFFFNLLYQIQNYRMFQDKMNI